MCICIIIFIYDSSYHCKIFQFIVIKLVKVVVNVISYIMCLYFIVKMNKVFISIVFVYLLMPGKYYYYEITFSY